jgi:thioredoxin reductase (NADPH)
VKEFDVVVVGAGVAGLTAGLIAAQHGLSVGIVDQMGTAGQVLNVDKIENMPGFPQGVPGYDLGPIIQEQAEAAGAEFVIDTARSLEVAGEKRVLHCDEEDLSATALIIAAGSSLRNLGIPGEEQFMGKGVSHCASCDGAFFSGNSVAVIGGGDSAIEEAAVLTQHVDKVLVFQNAGELTAQSSLINAIESQPSVEFFYNSEVEEIIGDDAVTAVRVRDKDSGQTREEPVAGVFVYIGLEPNTQFVRDQVELDSGGHIVVDIMMRTSIPGVFAAGDIRQHSVSLVASAIGDGATAAVGAYRYIYGL